MDIRIYVRFTEKEREALNTVIDMLDDGYQQIQEGILLGDEELSLEKVVIMLRELYEMEE